MKSFPVLLRRLHVYLALVCMPWFLMYGVTAIAFNHSNWFKGPNDLYNLSGPSWTKEHTWECSIEVPAEGEVPRDVATRMLEVAGIQANAYGAFRSGKQQISVYITNFWETKRLAYDTDKQQMSLYIREPVASSTMTLMHGRAGYHHDSPLDDLWAVMVDITVLGVLTWVATGLFMWWQQPKLRRIGAVSLLAGTATFIAFMISI